MTVSKFCKNIDIPVQEWYTILEHTRTHTHSQLQSEHIFWQEKQVDGYVYTCKQMLYCVKLK